MGVYCSVAVSWIRPYCVCGIRFQRENQCGMQFFCCNAVAEKWNLSKRLTVLSLTSWQQVVCFVPETLHFTLILLDKRHYLSRLRIAVKVRSAKFVDSQKFSKFVDSQLWDRSKCGWKVCCRMSSFFLNL